MRAFSMPGRPDPMPGFDSLFDFLPIGAYRSRPDGTMVRANRALVRLNGYDSEAELLGAVHDIASEWYLDPTRRAEFQRQLEHHGEVRAFVSEVRRHKTGERIWISENAHAVRDAEGRTVWYEGTVEDISSRVATEAALRDNEEQLRQVTHQIPGLVFKVHVDAQRRRNFSFVSSGVRELYGLEPEAVLADGTLLQRARHPDDSEDVEVISERARQLQEPVAAEYRIVRADGELRWVRLTSTALQPDPTGRGHFRIGVIVDVTDRYLAQQALRDSEARWKLALDSAGDGVWDWNLETGVEQLSPRCKEIYGYAPDELADLARELDERTHPDDLDGMRRDRQAHFDGLTPMYVNEHRVRCKDGRWKWVLSRGMVIARDAAGKPLRMIGTHTDISERKQAEALRLERDRAESAQRHMSEFLSRVSHELRTPLNAVLGFAQLMELSPETPERHRPWVAELLGSGRHLLGLVEDVLDLTGAQSGEMSVELADVPLHAVVEEAWAMLAAPAAALALRYDDGLADQPLPPVRADRRRLKQVLANLLSNAVKYNRPGGSVVVRAAVQGGRVQLDVSDTGRGMKAEQLDRLFQPFERLGAQRGPVAGTGLGLALSRQLLEAMGGQISVSSTPERGSTFRLQLPVAG